MQTHVHWSSPKEQRHQIADSIHCSFLCITLHTGSEMEFDELSGRTALFHVTVLSRATARVTPYVRFLAEGMKAVGGLTACRALTELLTPTEEAYAQRCAEGQRLLTLDAASAPAPVAHPKPFLAKGAPAGCVVVDVSARLWQAVPGGKHAALFVQTSPSEAFVVIRVEALPPSVLAACKGGDLDMVRAVVAGCTWMHAGPCTPDGRIVTMGQLAPDVDHRAVDTDVCA